MPTAVSELKEINLDYLKLEVNVPQKLIRLYWKRQVNNSELRTGFYTAAQVAETYGCKYWLGDARNTTMLSVGKLKKNRLPCPGRLSTPIDPP